MPATALSQGGEGGDGGGGGEGGASASGATESVACISAAHEHAKKNGQANPHAALLRVPAPEMRAA